MNQSGDDSFNGPLREPKLEVDENPWDAAVAREEAEADEAGSVIETSAILQPKVPMKEPSIKKLEHDMVMRGEPVTIRATIENAVEAHWYIQKKRLYKDTPGVKTIMTKTQGVFILKLDTVIVSECVICVRGWNGKSVAKDKISLTFKDASTNDKMPEIFEHLDHLYATEGEEVQFHVKALHAKRYIWELNGSPLETTGKGVFDMGNFISFDPVAIHHSGAIRVLAINDAGSAHSHGRLTVRPKNPEESDVKPEIKREEPEANDCDDQSSHSSADGSELDVITRRPVLQQPAPPAAPPTVSQAQLDLQFHVAQWGQAYTMGLQSIQAAQDAPLPLLGIDPYLRALQDTSTPIVKPEPVELEPHEACEGGARTAKRRRTDGTSTSADQ